MENRKVWEDLLNIFRTWNSAWDFYEKKLGPKPKTSDELITSLIEKFELDYKLVKVLDFVAVNFDFNQSMTNIEKVLEDSPDLNECTRIYASELEKQGIEIFKRDRNMLVTEKGYILIFRDTKKAET